MYTFSIYIFVLESLSYSVCFKSMCAHTDTCCCGAASIDDKTCRPHSESPTPFKFRFQIVIRYLIGRSQIRSCSFPGCVPLGSEGVCHASRSCAAMCCLSMPHITPLSTASLVACPITKHIYYLLENKDPYLTVTA